MKKTILILLAVLPIVLVIIIAFAGRILAIYQHIPVERVEFITDDGDPFTDDMEFVIGQGESKSCKIKIYPELSSNKKVSYSSSNEEICTVDKDGVVTGVHYGATTIMVKTDDGGKIAMLNVLVTADIPIGVTIVTHGDVNTPQIPMDTLELIEGEEYNLDVIVELPVALDKRVEFSSDNPDVVSVDATGTLVAKAEGTVTITVTTVSGNYSDTCVVTVVKGELPLTFDLDAAAAIPGVEIINGVCVIPDTDTLINVYELLKIRADIDPATVNLSITSGDAATLTDGVVAFHNYGLVVVRAYVGDRANPTYYADLRIAYRP